MKSTPEILRFLERGQTLLFIAINDIHTGVKPQAKAICYKLLLIKHWWVSDLLNEMALMVLSLFAGVKPISGLEDHNLSVTCSI